jgi:hypothetical protein
METPVIIDFWRMLFLRDRADREGPAPAQRQGQVVKMNIDETAMPGRCVRAIPTVLAFERRGGRSDHRARPKSAFEDMVQKLL